jgi:hypothetical protein
VVASASEQAAAFENLINESECLSSQRGRLLERNSCRNGWVNFLDLSLRQTIPTLARQGLALQVDVFNFLNLLNENWGQVRTASGFSTENLVTHVSQTSGDAATSMPVVQFNPAYRQFTTESLGSNYQLQLSVRYSF